MFVFVFISITLSGGSKISHWVLCQSILPIFSSESLIVFGVTFRSLIHFEFKFMYSVREYSDFIPLNVAIQFSQHHLLRRLSFFSTVYSCLLCHRLFGLRYVSLFLEFLSCFIDLYFCFFVPVPYCLYYCSFVVLSEIGEPDSSYSIFLSEDHFGYLGVLCLHTNCTYFFLF